MSSTKTGDELEAKIYTLFEEEIEAGRFFVKQDCCKIFKKKGYYSKDREKDIVFDIAIEIYLPGSNAYSMVCIIECKNYNHAVPVDDAEEFFAKLQQVSGANLKGVIASTGSFQDGTLKYCKSKGIGVLRYFDARRFKWILHRSPSMMNFLPSKSGDWLDIYQGLTVQSHLSRHFDFFCYDGMDYSNSLHLFFLNLARQGIQDESTVFQIENSVPPSKPLVKFVSHDEIEKLSETVLQAVNYEGGEVLLSEICDWQSNQIGLSVNMTAEQSPSEFVAGILGRITFDPLEISIFRHSDRNHERHRFTLAHELGHLFLDHSKYMAGEYCQEKDFESLDENNLTIDDIRRMELQANDFASCLLLPKNEFVNDVLSLLRRFDIKNRGFGMLYVDEQKCNQAGFYSVTNVLKSKYKVSRSAVRVRLEKLGMIDDKRFTKT